MSLKSKRERMNRWREESTLSPFSLLSLSPYFSLYLKRYDSMELFDGLFFLLN